MDFCLRDFGKSAQKLSRNPLGIIALFIVLVYGIAGLVLGLSAGQLQAPAKTVVESGPMEGMTRAQIEVWKTILAFERPWSIRDVVRKCGRSQPTVNTAVHLFAECGLVEETSRQGKRRFFSVLFHGR